MRRTYLVSLPVAVLFVIVLVSAAHPAAQQKTNATAGAVSGFNKQVTLYMDLHKKEAASTPDVKKDAQPAEVMGFEKALAGRIAAARATAKQGDVFVPDVTPVFKKIFQDYYRRRSGREKRLLFDEVPDFKLQVNMIYPVDAPKATFPPRLALALPQLPEQLEYRLVGTNLVLRDSGANLVVDFITNVLPPSSKSGSPQ
jgi:hypothetical protein